jgi:hypothetical protein
MTKALIPKMILNYFGDRSYLAVGLIETGRVGVSVRVSVSVRVRVTSSSSLTESFIGKFLPQTLTLSSKVPKPNPYPNP